MMLKNNSFKTLARTGTQPNKQLSTKKQVQLLKIFLIAV
jgi:hypothetical protein